MYLLQVCKTGTMVVFHRKVRAAKVVSEILGDRGRRTCDAYSGLLWNGLVGTRAETRLCVSLPRGKFFLWGPFCFRRGVLLGSIFKSWENLLFWVLLQAPNGSKIPHEERGAHKWVGQLCRQDSKLLLWAVIDAVEATSKSCMSASSWNLGHSWTHWVHGRGQLLLDLCIVMSLCDTEKGTVTAASGLLPGKLFYVLTM